jgi:cyclopropane-fatty-acyl-phospholipid synthase
MKTQETTAPINQREVGRPARRGWLEARLRDLIGSMPVRIQLPSGWRIDPSEGLPVATVVIADWPTVVRLLWDPEIAFCEAYAAGRIAVQGSLAELLEAVEEHWPTVRTALGWAARLSSWWMRLWQANTLSGSRDNIHHHYDLGNDFYRLWLDEQMVYTCAYFARPDMTLEEAQIAKMDHICRKLRLRSGERVVEAGCGWGALALHMAQRYGVRVRAFNISREQIRYATERARQLGLSKQVEFIEDDYRNITGAYDVFVSVGMLEHIGREHYRVLGQVIHRTIGERGRGLLHFIGRSHRGEFSRWMRKRIFPGAYAPSLAEALDVFEPWRYQVLDIENLRPHYARTLEEWLLRFDRASEDVRQLFGPWFERAWRLYLAGSRAAFRKGSLQLYQVLFAGSKADPLPQTRAWLYAHELGVESCAPTT